MNDPNFVRIRENTPIIVREDFAYSDQDRLLTHTHQINGGVVELLSKNEYDELGQLVKKSVGKTESNPLQQVDYSYNIRGWLTEINKTDELNPQGSIADLFAFKINYNTVENTLHSQINPLYNGNIAETYWKTSSDSHLRGYGYIYDNLNRLNTSFYHKNGLSTGCYDESLSYDKNGNIQSLLRFGNSDGQNMALKIDELAYTYHADKKNQLLKVFDSTNNFLGFDDDSPDGIADNDDDYDYDANGNMIKDQNKAITSVSYNHLNLPVRIIFNNDLNTKIDYIYRADGSKIQKKAFSYNPPPGNFGPISAVTEYMGGFQYKLGVLQFFPTAEGYVNHTSGSYSYVYNYLDHLGNIRLSYAQDPQNPATLKIIEENHYYPFGLKHTNYNIDVLAFEKNSGNLVLKAPVGGPKPLAYQYKYNGKEFQDELGLNLYDYGARNYDPAIGRWMNIDPLAEINSDWTPYRYGFNNPLTYTDPTGMLESTHTDEEGNVIAVYDDGDLGVYKHSNNADGGTPTKANIDKRHEKSTSAGGEKMGTTEFWNEFIIPGTNQAAGTILFGETSSWEPLIEKANNAANNQDLSVTMEQSKLNQKLDIKNNKNWAPESTGGNMTGRLLNGKYSTARSAGNYLAGMNGVTGTFQGMHISGETYMKIAGAYQVGQLSKANILRILTFGTSFGPAPYYGEEEYSGRRILQGITAGEKKLKN